MAVVIRLKTMGTKKKIKHRLVVTDSRFPRNGRFLEEVGYWDPSKEPAIMSVKGDRVKHWMSHGAVPSDTVRSILKKAGVLTFDNTAKAKKPKTEQSKANTAKATTAKSATPKAPKAKKTESK